MGMVNRLSFEVAARDAGLPSLVPRIDGTSLIALVKDYEAGLTDGDGDYGGFEMVHVTVRPDGLQFTGCEDPYRDPEDPSGSSRILTLACNCGDAGCWPLTARARRVGDNVVWDEFQQPHRPERDYSSFGPFTFEAGPYREALEVAGAEARQFIHQFEQR